MVSVSFCIFLRTKLVKEKLLWYDDTVLYLV